MQWHGLVTTARLTVSTFSRVRTVRAPPGGFFFRAEPVDLKCAIHNKIVLLLGTLRSRDSSVGIATGYGLDDRTVEVRIPVGSRIFSTMSRPALGSTQPPFEWVPGALSPEVKRQGREADHSTPASAEVRKMWIYTSTPPYAFMAYCLISYAKGQLYLFTENFTVTTHIKARTETSLSQGNKSHQFYGTPDDKSPVFRGPLFHVY
jgi:hypothetical protein